jgi:hypothetical protein
MFLKYGYSAPRGSSPYAPQRDPNTDGFFITENTSVEFNRYGDGTPVHFKEMQAKASADRGRGGSDFRFPGVWMNPYQSATISQEELDLAMRATAIWNDGIIDVTPSGIRAAQALMQRRQANVTQEANSAAEGATESGETPKPDRRSPARGVAKRRQRHKVAQP